MEEEDIDTRLTLRVSGGGGGQSGGHRRRRPPVQPDVFPPQVKEEMGSHTATHDHHQESPVRKKVEKGARKKIKIDGDGNCTDGRSASCGARKKLRLTKEQSARLEGCFQAHNILSQAQKQELAPQLSLSKRQVEVWFQNRRARTKLKQTEADCEQLRRCCDRLTEENCRLKQELEGLKRELQFYVRLPTVAPAAVRVCPSCENATAVARGG